MTHILDILKKGGFGCHPFDRIHIDIGRFSGNRNQDEIEVEILFEHPPSDRFKNWDLKRFLAHLKRTVKPARSSWRKWLSITSVANDIAHGVHSGIPICCVLYYALFWRTMWAYPQILRRHQGLELREYYSGLVRTYEKRLPLATMRVSDLKGARLQRARLMFQPKYQYIPCPICLLTGRIVPIRDCIKEDCDCEWCPAH